MSVPMDRGRSWLVLCAAVVAFLITTGACHGSMGVYYVVFRRHFGESSTSTVALITSLPFAFVIFCGPISSFLYETYGSRISMMLSGAISSFGFVLCSFAQDVYQVLACFLLIAVGYGINTTSVISVQTEYFDKYQNFALAFVYIGGAIGFVFGRFLTVLVHVYGWRGAMLIYAGISMQMLICAALMKSRRTRIKPECSNLFPTYVLKNPMTICLCVAASLAFGSLMLYMNFINAFMISRGMKPETAALFMSLSSATNFVGRLLASCLSHNHKISGVLMIIVLCLINGAASLAAVFCSGTVPFLLNTAVFSFGYGSFVSLTAVVIVELFGAVQLPKIVGMCSIPVGAALLLTPKVAGHFIDLYGLEAGFYLAAGSSFLAALFYAPQCLLARRTRENLVNHNTLALIVEEK